jgi:alkanesulfonate monooxygenase SsuD/methylene tetrahydromethanopterin reductase-like flavin-dependent oxidoreductase (luciferase family)
VKFGLAFASSICIDGPTTIEVCRRAEEAGFESVWGGEHVVRPDNIESAYPYAKDGKIPMTPDTPVPDPLIWLSYAAAVAPTLTLGTCILIVPQRTGNLRPAFWGQSRTRAWHWLDEGRV